MPSRRSLDRYRARRNFGLIVLWDRRTYRNLTERDGHEVPVEELADKAARA